MPNDIQIVNPREDFEKSSDIGDFITILRCHKKLDFAKTIYADGSISAYKKVKTVDIEAWPLPADLSLEWLDTLLRDLLPQSTVTAVFGEIADPGRVKQVRRLSGADTETGDLPTLKPTAHRWAALDMDKVLRPESLAPANLAGCAALVIKTLPAVFHGVRCIVQATSGQGIKPEIRLRLWYLLDRWTTGYELAYWLKAVVDPATFRPAQCIYTAAPLLADGATDPITIRQIILPGDRDVVVVPPPDALRPPPRPVIEQAGDPAEAGDYQVFIDRCLTKMRGAGKGEQHDVRRDVAMLLGGVQAACGFTDGEALGWLRAAHVSPGWEQQHNAEATILWGLEKGRAKPIKLKQTKPPSQDWVDYVVENGAICHRRWDKAQGEVLEPLCNFVAEIVADVTSDDGADRERLYLISGGLGEGKIAAEAFTKMAWVDTLFGASAYIMPEKTAASHLAVAIKALSNPARRTVYTHLGWRRIGGSLVYLHSGGAIGGELDGAVEVDGKLELFKLMPVPVDRPASAILASLAVVDIVPANIGYCSLGATYRAPLCEFAPATSSLYYAGDTGAQKTAYALMWQAHFGVRMATDAPFNWENTAGANERHIFLAKDVLQLIDDFHPRGSSADVQKKHAEADRVLRGQANKGGRDRLKVDASGRPGFPPRGMVLATGEDLPSGHSLRARVTLCEFEKGDVQLDKLSMAQRLAKQGAYVTAMTAYVQWLTTCQIDWAAKLDALRTDLRRGTYGHGRTPDNAADLLIGVEAFLLFAVEAGALRADEADDHRVKARSAILAGAKDQAAHQASENPVQQFGDLIAACISSGRYHIAEAQGDGGEPEGAGAFGWRMNTVTGAWDARGDCLGWVNGNNLYLEPNAAFAAVQVMARAQGSHLAITQTVLWKRLDEAKRLVSREKANLTIWRTINKARKRVLHLNTTQTIGLVEPLKSLYPANF